MDGGASLGPPREAATGTVSKSGHLPASANRLVKPKEKCQIWAQSVMLKVRSQSAEGNSE